ncbi:unnamed protein product [Effrenium voratum]|nr:unnamed protein product [Effrenium voratum]CAJ1415355.1 unnamed protein product [Effrenium voratum]
MARAKAKDKSASWKVKSVKGEAGEAGEDREPRQRVKETRFLGVITEWRGYMGWLQPLSKVEHEQASRHWGLLYVSQQDVQAVDGVVPWMKAGRIVDFFVYSDGDGLGAEEVRALSPLRLTLSHSEAKALLKPAGSPQWSEYLTDSEYYLNFTRDLGVLVRQYSWPLPFATLELWGLIKDVARAALSFSTAGGAQRRLALLLPEAHIAKVEPLPGHPKVSTHAVLQQPVPCRSLTLESSAEECEKAVVEFLHAMEGRS